MKSAVSWCGFANELTRGEIYKYIFLYKMSLTLKGYTSTLRTRATAT